MSTDSRGKGGSKRKAPDDQKVAVDDEKLDRFIRFSIKGQDGRELFFKVRKDNTLIKPFQIYCERMNLEYQTIQFLLDGNNVNGKRKTPNMLGMEDGDQIDAMRHQLGGGGGGEVLNF